MRGAELFISAEIEKSPSVERRVVLCCAGCAGALGAVGVVAEAVGAVEAVGAPVAADVAVVAAPEVAACCVGAGAAG